MQHFIQKSVVGAAEHIVCLAVNQNLGCRVFPGVFKERNEQAIYLLYLNCSLL